MGTISEQRTGRNPHMAVYPENIREKILSDVDMNADAYIFKINADNMNGTALTYFGAKTSYAQFDKEIDELARCLRGYGVEKGDYVALCMPNLKELVLYYYAIWRIGAVAVAIDPRTNASGIMERAAMTKSKLLVTVLDIIPGKIDEVMDTLPCKNMIVVTPADSMNSFGTAKNLLAKMLYSGKKKKSGLSEDKRVIWHTDFLKSYSFEGDVHAPYESEQVAVVLFTSGTSADGIVKGAIHTHSALNASAASFKFRARGSVGRGDTFGGFIPFFAAYGAFNAMHMALNLGMNIVLIPVFKPLEFDKMIFKYKPNCSLGVPRFFELLARSKKLRKGGKQLNFIKETIIGGDKITPASIREINACWERCGAQRGPRVGYGSTELGGCVSGMRSYPANVSTDEYPWDTEGNVGLILPCVDVLVVDPETGEELPIGADGELCVGGYTMMKGYYGKPKETEEITYIAADGKKYYRMGDKGHLGQDGHFYFTDRYKRSMMRPDGHTVHPSPIENVIAGHPSVDSCAVAGLKKIGEESRAGVIPCAFIVTKEGMEPADKDAFLHEVDKLCRKELPERDMALAYTLVERLPYTLMGKVDFRKLENEEKLDVKRFIVTDFAFFPELTAKKK
ncbi:MAG: acyl--CoA ligase [Clostridium sp.]|jgi:long-chain acyl-CoA synthetase|nr:acyl--CoA ligase [Clostridium sp.]